MRSWKWKQPNSVLDVVSDPVDGFVRVFKNGELIYQKEGLKRREVELIESNFLKIVTNSKEMDLNYIM